MKKLHEIFKASGIPGLYQAFREHAREVRQAQDDFQNRIQRIGDEKGLDAVDAEMKKEAAERRAIMLRKLRGPF